MGHVALLFSSKTKFGWGIEPLCVNHVLLNKMLVHLYCSRSHASFEFFSCTIFRVTTRWGCSLGVAIVFYLFCEIRV